MNHSWPKKPRAQTQTKMLTRTQQQSVYETAYRQHDDSYGLPDRKIVNGVAPREKKILTLGGGNSNDLWWLRSENLIVNVDYAFAGLQAGSRHGVQAVHSDLNLQPELPFADQCFDIVVCKDILEHLLEPLRVLKEAVRVLRDRGHIVVSVPNHFYWPMRLRLLIGKGLIWNGLVSHHGGHYREWDYMHVRFFTYRGFRTFLHAAGLRPIRFYWDFGSLGHYYNPDMWLEPQLWKRRQGRSVSHRAKLGLYVVRPLWNLLNVVFPRRLRSAIVGLAPGLLCACFYARCTKAQPSGGP